MIGGEIKRIKARRELLLAQAALQRATLAAEIAPWRPRLALADRGIAVARYVRRYPALLAAAGLLVAVLRPHRAAGWVQRGVLAWQIGRSLRERWQGGART